ncbi:MAG: hypothetical protein PHW92_06720 [Lutibacter sp.]|nr:hypothetical protein [Lutibacter sp.]
MKGKSSRPKSEDRSRKTEDGSRKTTAINSPLERGLGVCFSIFYEERIGIILKNSL